MISILQVSSNLNVSIISGYRLSELPDFSVFFPQLKTQPQLVGASLQMVRV